MPGNEYLWCWICGNEIKVRPDCIRFGIATQGLPVCPDCAGELKYVSGNCKA